MKAPQFQPAILRIATVGSFILSGDYLPVNGAANCFQESLPVYNVQKLISRNIDLPAKNIFVILRLDFLFSSLSNKEFQLTMCN